MLKYFKKEKNLKRFLNVGKKDIKKFLAEADDLTKMMLKRTGNLILDTMLSKLRGPIVYVCVRASEPSIIIETGVASGSSTYYILQAMELNGNGHLYSIDLPNVDIGSIIPNGKEVGWLVPSELKHRWELILGSSKEKLPSLLYNLKEIDAFLHDSEHTYETMIFEYNTVWPYLREAGFLLSDDVHWNNAFRDFISEKHNALKRFVFFDGLGGIIK